ncbi:MAG: 50S ribosome-binding GTPase [Candidatus Diapherotrites archaeon]|uniref:50S ribosome-binding GTPase n=1 Tax=Candidatus Iainarchaeum sp. TaxID=3101447 RepID=A0A8T4LEA7_9ARCH|nr:50S ribosome-binding GTPase [Candidatus Diapherotrites archaeon]
MGLFYHAKKAVDEADVVIEILDARFPDLTRNTEMEEHIQRKRKQLVFVLNKSDLTTKETAEKNKKELSKIAPTVFVSVKQKQGTAILRNELKRVVHSKFGKKNSRHRKVLVAIIGYPNTGKSSILNALTGRRSAKTSAQAGYTRGRQFIKLEDDLFLVDSPGVIPFLKRDDIELALVGAKSPNQLPDVEGAALGILDYMKKENPNSWTENFGFDATDSQEMLDRIAKAKKRLLKGGGADTENTSKIVVQDWQNGKIRV